MKPLRVTNLEKFRRFRDDVSSFDTEEAVIDTLSGAFTGNDYTWIGTAFHKIVEDGEKAWNNGIVHTRGGDVAMDEAQRDLALLYRSTLPGAFHEVRLDKEYKTRLGKVLVTGCADVIHGTIIRDIKTRYSPPVQQEYIDSYQWRFYLDIFDLDRFIFDIFEFKGYDKEMGMNVAGLPVKQFDPIPCQRYLKMEEDMQRLLDDFSDWIHYRGLEHLLSDETNHA